MAFITTGLTNSGLTTHYQVEYDDSLSQADGKDRANALIAAIEGDFNLMSGWFGGIALTVITPMVVQITTSSGGASWAANGSGTTVVLKPGSGTPASFLRYLLVAEVVEIFMLSQNAGWFGNGDEGSAGEGLSRFLGTQFLVANGLGAPLSGFLVGNDWMNSPRADFVNNIDPTDNAPDPKTGCSTLFINYLHHQLGFSINAIVGAAASTLGGVYKNLTGDASDPFPFFKGLLDTAFPGTTTIPTANQDDPYPLGTLSFWVDKSTFGKDEVTDMVTPPHNGTFSDAFWLVLEGFNRQVLGAATPSVSGAATGFAGITIAADPSGVEYERPGDQLAPQRVRFPFFVKFNATSPAGFPTAANSPLEDELDASITVIGGHFPASTVLEFVAGADPYFTNVDPAQKNVAWLSQDLRVFTATPSLNNTPVPGAPAFGADSFTGAYAYIQSLVTHLNGTYGDPTGTDPFNAANNVIPGQAGAFTGDSSVTPSTASGGAAHANYNFALARVRLRGSEGVAGEAQNVRVFFRLWGTQSADTDYQPGSTYPSHLDAKNLPDWPLPATDNHTIPFFATGNSPNFADPSNPEYGTNGVNDRTIVIDTGDSRWSYFGCFLNVYDPSNTVNGSAVQSVLPGTHHCIVAQIASDDAPIVNSNGVTMSPGNSDKLAQRNLQVTHSDNPGAPATHLIPQTFDVRPSAPIAAGPGALLDYPDELMIDWGNTPPGSTASLYWPQVNAADVLTLSARLYASQRLSASDPHTLQCKVTRGVTYVPIPTGAGQNFAGLFTVDLPPTVVKGQEFDIVVRRVSTRRFREEPPPRIAPKGNLRLKKATATRQREEKGQRNWRYVTGAFQVKIPVSTKDAILPAEENTLAILKWRLGAMTPTGRWYPVLERYISYLSARVAGLGGDPTAIPPSLDGAPMKGGKPHPHPQPHPCPVEYTGKVTEVIYDCFGDFQGFVLGGCCDTRAFKTREREIGDLAIRACKERLALSVFVGHGHEPRIEKLVIRA